MANITLGSLILIMSTTKFKKEKLFHTVKHSKHNICRKSQERLWDKFGKEEKNSNPKTREQLIMQYAYLVNWVVNRLPINALKGLDREDLIGYGTIGLIEAIDRFDQSRNSNFESFAMTRIRGSIYDQLRAADHLSRGSRKRVKNLIKVTQEMEQRLGRYPSDGELAGELKVSLEDLRTVQRESQIGIYSLDDFRGSDESSTTVVDTISSNDDSIIDELTENELKQELTKAIDLLPEREKAVIGLYHYKRLTFKEIAEVMSFSESRASQLHARAISLLKSRMVQD